MTQQAHRNLRPMPGHPQQTGVGEYLGVAPGIARTSVGRTEINRFHEESDKIQDEVWSRKQFERCTRHLTTSTGALLLGGFSVQSRARGHASLVPTMCSMFLGATSSISCSPLGGRGRHTVAELVASSCKTSRRRLSNPWLTFPGKGC